MARLASWFQPARLRLVGPRFRAWSVGGGRGLVDHDPGRPGLGGEFVAWWTTTPATAVGPRLPHGGIIRRVIATLRAMPPGIRIFLGYAFLVLGLIGLSLRWVVDQAISAPISPPGLVVMVLLAYTIFTTTLVLQRKEAARGLALGLSTLTIPAVPLALLAAQPVFAVFVGALAILLFTGLTRPAVRAWLNEP